MATRAASSRLADRRVPHPSVDDRRARGLEARDRAPLSSHDGWAPASDRPDPVGLLQEQNRTREPDLVPVRHGRMLVSPFTFYRGAAKIMAADLAGTPTAGLKVQLCGDAHLSNFGVFASPERRAAVRPERLRRDPAGAVRVRRQADGGQLHHRRPQQRLRQGRHPGGDAGRRWRPTGRRWPASPRWARWTSGTRTWTEDELLTGPMRRRRAKGAKTKKQAKAVKRAEKSAEKTARQGPHPRQPAGAVQARRAGRRPVPDRQPAPDRGPDAGTWRPPTACPPTRSSGCSTSSSAPTGPPCATTSASCWSSSSSSTWPARWSGWAASAPGPSSSCSRAATSRTRCSCRSRRRPGRSWRTTCPRAATSSTASGWCTASG